MRVYVVGGNSGIERMYTDRGYHLVSSVERADLVQFTGGADVTPSLYGQQPHPTTNWDRERDAFETLVFEECVATRTNMVGICRGAQFLCVMNGDSLWQDVDGHALQGTHAMTDTRTGRVIYTTSTHHQMMRPDLASCELIAVASEASRKECVHNPDIRRHVVGAAKDQDAEVVWYPDTDSLCFQGHPEYVERDHQCQQYFFELIEEKF